LADEGMENDSEAWFENKWVRKGEFSCIYGAIYMLCKEM
jgi:hypothetical protein